MRRLALSLVLVLESTLAVVTPAAAGSAAPGPTAARLSISTTGQIVQNLAAGGAFCLDADAGGIGSDGTKVQLWHCGAGKQNQLWWGELSNGLILIHNVAAGPAFCLDADAGGIGSDGTRIQLWHCGAGKANQAWTTFAPNSDSIWQNFAAGAAFCLDADSGTIGVDGTRVQLWHCGPGKLNQEWQ